MKRGLFWLHVQQRFYCTSAASVAVHLPPRKFHSHIYAKHIMMHVGRDQKGHTTSAEMFIYHSYEMV